MKLIKNILKITLGLFLLAAVAGWIFWPENMAVKGPILDTLTGKQLGAPSDKALKNRLKVPAGMTVSVFAGNIPNARMMQVTKRGDVVISSIRQGDVYLVYGDANNDGASDGQEVLLSGLDTPHGLALYEDWLYVAETHQIFRIKFNAESRKISGDKELVLSDIPAGGNHRSRTIGFGPDGMLYVTIGSSCNVCIEDNPFRATMLKMTPEGKNVSIYASGLRNAVGFDWKPDGAGAGFLFATDNGRDLLGDDTPNCELNLIQEGGFYGWPHAYDDGVKDPDHGEGFELEISNSIHPYHGFGAHTAPLGMRFIKADLAPKGYENTALVALHGSWNRSELVGYKVVALHYQDDGSVLQSDFMSGFEQDEDVIGRPVDIVQSLDGAFYISDDYAGVIYRVAWGDMIKADKREITDKKIQNPLQDVSETEMQMSEQIGALLFDVHGCANCHIQDATPEGVQVKELEALGERYTIKSLSNLLIVPPSPMPSFNFSDEQARALSIYLLNQTK